MQLKFTFLLSLLLLFLPVTVTGQYEFSGVVDLNNRDGRIYLSVVDDYRKISGVYPEQILNETRADTTGHFVFKGNNLPAENKIYRIHVDNCTPEDQDVTHFTGHCPNSKEVVFVANNQTKLSLPFTFDDQMFCAVVSDHEKANAFLKIDSLKNDMRFAFGTYRSEANRRINSKKWFSILQQYGEQLQEPLAELYSYAFLSDRSSDLYHFYLQDLRSNSYYEELLARLKDQYPDTPYTLQYESELRSDQYLVQDQAGKRIPWWMYLVAGIAVFSILLNLNYFQRLRKMKHLNSAKAALTQTEQKVLQLILEDKSNKEIASQLFVSVSTVKTHINNLYKKLQVSTRSEVKALYT
ncbi:MAG: response regulator transcription factor [Bacteroidia bacterium]|nr:response regulator transcription factor [Bacteroidia bacterium]NNM24286.1 response regulator transcription factor [Flavobacteriaceae bacterium]